MRRRHRLAILPLLVALAPPGSAVQPLNRIGFRGPVGGDPYPEFYDTVTGTTFVPRGNVYTIVVPHGHAQFDPGVYDALQAEDMLSAMEAHGYNIIRVYLSQISIGGSLTVAGVDPAYMDNVIDFLTRATVHRIYVVIVPPVFLPANYTSTVLQDYLQLYPKPSYIHGLQNSMAMSRAHRMAYADLLRDILRYVESNAPGLLTTIFSINHAEAWYDPAKQPWTLSSNSLTFCDAFVNMGDPDSRQLGADTCSGLWATNVRDTIRSEVPGLMVASSVVTPLEVGWYTYNGVIDCPSCGPFYPMRLNAIAAVFDYADIHVYSSLDRNIVDLFDSAEWSQLHASKPRMATEFYARKANYAGDVEKAVADVKRHLRETCKFGLRGWLFWVWTNIDPSNPNYQFWTAVENDGLLARELSPYSIPSPCGGLGAPNIITGLGPATRSSAQHPLARGHSFDGVSTVMGPTQIDAYAEPSFGVHVAAGVIDPPCSTCSPTATATVLTTPGPDPARGPHVRGWDWFYGGLPRANLNFFTAGSQEYGATIATGDLRPDARGRSDEMLTGVGPGPTSQFAPTVRGWDYEGGPVQALPGVSFYAFQTANFGVNVASGDIDGDGIAEIVTGAGPGPMFGAGVRVFGYDGAVVTQVGALSAFNGASYGARVSGGDYDADGVDGLLSTPGPGPLMEAAIRGWKWDGSTGVFTMDVEASSPFPGTYYGAHASVTHFESCGASGECMAMLVGQADDPSAGTRVRGYRALSGTGVPLPGCDFEAFPGQAKGASVAGVPEAEAFQ